MIWHSFLWFDVIFLLFISKNSCFSKFAIHFNKWLSFNSMTLASSLAVALYFTNHCLCIALTINVHTWFGSPCSTHSPFCCLFYICVFLRFVLKFPACSRKISSDIMTFAFLSFLKLYISLEINFNCSGISTANSCTISLQFTFK